MSTEMQTRESSSLKDNMNSQDKTELNHSDHELNGDLSITALYTAGVWYWAGFEYAELVTSIDSKRVFKVTNFALSIMRLFRWKLPKLAQGLAQRHSLIDQLSQELPVKTIVELASGLSTRSFRHCHNHDLKQLEQYIEVDLPHVIKHKQERLHQAGKLPPTLQFHAQDLKFFEAEKFKEQFRLSDSLLVIAEGLVMYLKAEELKVLFLQIATLLKTSQGRLVFDWLPSIEEPSPGFLGRTLGYLMKKFTGGNGFERDQRSRHDMIDLLYELGAKNVELYDTKLIAKSRNLPFTQAHTQQLIFCADF